MAGASKRPGISPTTQLEQPIRIALEPLFDVVMRMTGVTTGVLSTLENLRDPALDPGTATTADVAERVNDIQTKLNEAIDKINAVISRIQED